MVQNLWCLSCLCERFFESLLKMAQPPTNFLGICFHTLWITSTLTLTAEQRQEEPHQPKCRFRGVLVVELERKHRGGSTVPSHGGAPLGMYVVHHLIELIQEGMEKSKTKCSLNFWVSRNSICTATKRYGFHHADFLTRKANRERFGLQNHNAEICLLRKAQLWNQWKLSWPVLNKYETGMAHQYNHIYCLGENKSKIKWSKPACK